MIFSKYIEMVRRTESVDFELILGRLNVVKVIRALHGTIGLVTETAELIDAMKKFIFYGKELDLINVKEELGDIMWYFAVLCDVFGFSIDDIMDKNIEKLNKRYPNGFTEVDAINRDVDFELEGFNK